MTTITGKAIDAAGAPLKGQPVTARLVAATTALAPPGGQVIVGADTVTAADGTWSLTLTPLSLLAQPAGAYYVVVVGLKPYTINVPASGSHELGSVLLVPGPLPDTGATVAALNTHATHANIIKREAGQPLPPGTPVDTIVVRKQA